MRLDREWKAARADNSLRAPHSSADLFANSSADSSADLFANFVRGSIPLQV
ncbi:hypothetical protein [Paraburkholderia acidisoli]|uniref:Uncharacterized protein n=1 Tax=Paraburkholderia acidisoli TaxID=2571748 RepID=A0A7Z2JJY4_9BURK|nr:hypothetical protein [Paraburkholderia acidisoli]QGZ65855.1 hypothetical protein FAZ98_28865 [Paraburkholderia acidisoli]